MVSKLELIELLLLLLKFQSKSILTNIMGLGPPLNFIKYCKMQLNNKNNNNNNSYDFGLKKKAKRSALPIGEMLFFISQFSPTRIWFCEHKLKALLWSMPTTCQLHSSLFPNPTTTTFPYPFSFFWVFSQAFSQTLNVHSDPFWPPKSQIQKAHTRGRWQFNFIWCNIQFWSFLHSDFWIKSYYSLSCKIRIRI